MRILHINEYYAMLGGTENYLISLMRYLEKSGHENIVVYRTQDEKTLKDPLGKIYYLPRNNNISQCSEKLRQIIISERPDIIYLHNVYDYYIVSEAVKRCPTIRYVHDHQLYCRGAYKIFWRNEIQCPKAFGTACVNNAYINRCSSRNPLSVYWSMKNIKCQLIANRKVNKMIVASSYMKKNLEANGFKSENIEILPYFMDLVPSIEDKNTSAGKSVLFIGRISVEKGLKYLIQAFSKLPEDYKLVVAGDGPLMADMKKLSVDLGIARQVEFSGWVSKEKIHQYYQRAEILVFPSIWPEPFGCVGPEAIFFNRPVIAFDVGGVRDWLIEGQTGFLVKSRDVSELAEKIQLLMENKDSAKECRLNGFSLIKEKYSVEKHIEQLLKICDQAAADHFEAK